MFYFMQGLELNDILYKTQMKSKLSNELGIYKLEMVLSIWIRNIQIDGPYI